MAAAIKMDELLVSWLSSDSVYEDVLELIENYRVEQQQQQQVQQQPHKDAAAADGDDSQSSPRGVIPPFYPKDRNSSQRTMKRHPRTAPELPNEVWDDEETSELKEEEGTVICIKKLVEAIFEELGQDAAPLASPLSSSSDMAENNETMASNQNNKYLTPEAFVRITKELCHFPSFFNMPLYQRILQLWNARPDNEDDSQVVTLEMVAWFWQNHLQGRDAQDRFYDLVRQPENDFIVRDDFLPFIKALLNDHPGLEFLSTHAEFQEKYAVTVITRIFYCVNKCHSGRMTSRQVRRSDLLQAFLQVDQEEDINKVTHFFSYEHFYVLYCRFWELDHDRDYRITREDLLKYGDHSLSHMIVDRIFDAAPRPFEHDNNEFLSYEDFIYFMLSEEDKSNEVSVRYWFSCVDVDGDGKLNNMEMRSFYAVQLHRMQMMGHEIVPFEDMLCQMMDMIKPSNADYFVPQDFMQPECSQVSGSLFDALFNLNKYLLFEQRDPFVERQRREDEFECDWDRFACIDYNRLAMEEEAREEEAMEIDWVTVDDDDEDDDEHDGAAGQSGGAFGGDPAGAQAGGGGASSPSEAPF